MARKRLPGLVAAGLLLWGCLLSKSVDAQTAAHQSSRRYGSTSFDGGTGVAVNGAGEVYVTGEFSQSVSFGGPALSSAGGTDVFIAKYSPNGAHAWSRRGGGTNTDNPTSIAVDSAGNVVVVGAFFGTADFGGGNHISAGNNDVFVAKYDSGGTHLWSQRFGDTGYDGALAVAIDPHDNIYMTGYFDVKIDFGGGTLSSAGSSDIFVVKFDDGGGHLWSQRFGGTLSDVGRAVACRGTGAVTLAGHFQATANFGGGNLTSAGDDDVFMVDLTHAGTHRWSRRLGSVYEDNALAVAVDPGGSVLLTGKFYGSVDFGGGSLTSAGFSDIFLAKFDDAGLHAWSRRFGGTGSDAGGGLASDPDGNVLLTGNFTATADFGGGDVTSASGQDFFVARYDADGTYRWCRQAGGTGSDVGSSVAAAGPGAAVVTGYFTTSIDFGGGTLATAGFTDFFLAQFGPYSNEPFITSVADVGNDQGRLLNLRLDRSGFDASGSSAPVYSYEVYRRDDPPPAKSTDDSADKSTGERSGPTRLQLMDLGWTFVGEMPAHGQPSYAMDVPTIGDSTVSQGQYLSTFFVRAATASPVTYFDSPSAQGYSLDNLAPGVPSGLLYGAGALAWNPAAAGDFDYFVVYGSGTASFDDAAVIGHTTAPGFDVSVSPYPRYFVTAVDFAGNESGPAAADAAAGVGDLPTTAELSIACHPNPFNPLTSIGYTVPRSGLVTVEICDARGARVATLLDGGQRAAGTYRQDWNGRADSGLPVPSGIYFAHVRQDGATRTVKITLMR